MIPASGKVFAENEKVRLCVVKESEKQDYIALSYTYSCMKSAFKDEEFLDAVKGVPEYMSSVAVKIKYGKLLPHALPDRPNLFYSRLIMFVAI